MAGITDKLAKNVTADALATSKARNAALKERLSAANEEIDALEARIAELTAENEKLRNPTYDPPKPIVPEGPTTFRVTKGGLVNLNGSMTVIRQGQIVTLATHGADGLQHLRNAKIALEPVED